MYIEFLADPCPICWFRMGCSQPPMGDQDALALFWGNEYQAFLPFIKDCYVKLFYFPSFFLVLQSSSQTQTSPRPRGPRWWPWEASSLVSSPTGPRLWRRPCSGGAPSHPRPPASPPWTPTASRSMCSPTVKNQNELRIRVGLSALPSIVLCKISFYSQIVLFLKISANQIAKMFRRWVCGCQWYLQVLLINSILIQTLILSHKVSKYIKEIINLYLVNVHNDNSKTRVISGDLTISKSHKCLYMSDLKLTTAFVVSQTLTKFVADAFTKLSSRIIKALQLYC